MGGGEYYGGSETFPIAHKSDETVWFEFVHSMFILPLSFFCPIHQAGLHSNVSLHAMHNNSPSIQILMWTKRNMAAAAISVLVDSEA